jgi:hypothetical protein
MLPSAKLERRCWSGTLPIMFLRRLIVHLQSRDE